MLYLVLLKLNDGTCEAYVAQADNADAAYPRVRRSHKAATPEKMITGFEVTEVAGSEANAVSLVGVIDMLPEPCLMEA